MNDGKMRNRQKEETEMDNVNPTVREDQGYRYPLNGKGTTYQTFRKPTEREIQYERENSQIKLVRVEFVKGIMEGRILRIDEKYIRHVIKRGFARVIS